MKFNLRRDEWTGVISFQGEIRAADIVGLKLDRLDSMLLDDVARDGNATAADYLLVLEMLYRRHTEQAEDAEREKA